MKPQVWFGSITFGTFMIGGDSNLMAIVNKIQHVDRMTEEEADDYMVEHGYDSYLIPEQYNGEIVYDQSHEIILNKEEQEL